MRTKQALKCESVYYCSSLPNQFISRSVDEQPLPEYIRQEMEEYFGVSFSEVKFVIGREADYVGANAFTVDETIFISPGAFESDSVKGIRLICHELTHIVQRRLGLVRYKAQSNLGLLWDPFLEAQADRVAGSFGRYTRQLEWSAKELRQTRRTVARGILQCQARGLLNTNYIGGGINPPVPIAPAGIAFSGANSINEVWNDRAAAFGRAKALLGVTIAARRTYHWLFGADAVIDHGESLNIDGKVLAGANASQRAGRYYDFGRGRLIVEHPYDPNSTTAIGIVDAIQRGHFHVCAYFIEEGAESMYRPYDLPRGALHPPVIGVGPRVYDFDRRYRYEMFGGIQGHHIYYHALPAG